MIKTHVASILNFAINGCVTQVYGIEFESVCFELLVTAHIDILSRIPLVWTCLTCVSLHNIKTDKKKTFYRTEKRVETEH